MAVKVDISKDNELVKTMQGDVAVVINLNYADKTVESSISGSADLGDTIINAAKALGIMTTNVLMEKKEERDRVFIKALLALQEGFFGGDTILEKYLREELRKE